MNAGSEGRSTLDILDLMAAHVIEARALSAELAEGTVASLRPLFDCLLAELGRRIAAELPPAARTALEAETAGDP